MGGVLVAIWHLLGSRGWGKEESSGGTCLLSSGVREEKESGGDATLTVQQRLGVEEQWRRVLTGSRGWY